LDIHGSKAREIGCRGCPTWQCPLPQAFAVPAPFRNAKFAGPTRLPTDSGMINYCEPADRCRASTSMVSPACSLASPPFWNISNRAAAAAPTYLALVAPRVPSIASSASFATATDALSFTKRTLFPGQITPSRSLVTGTTGSVNKQ
jgi:hypothetical protein